MYKELAEKDIFKISDSDILSILHYSKNGPMKFFDVMEFAKLVSKETSKQLIEKQHAQNT